MSSVAFSANRYFLSGADCASTANWSTTSGGAGGASLPGSNDVAIFDGSSGNCDMGSANATLGAVDMTAGYTGTLKLTSGTLTIVGTSGTDGFTKAGGTLDHNSGTVQLRSGSGGTHVYINNAVTFNHLIFNSGDNWTMNLNAAIVTAVGNVTFSGGIVTNGTLKVEGNVSWSAGLGYEATSSSLTLEFSGSVSRNFDLSNDASDAVAGTVRVNKTSGTVTLIGNLDVSGAAVIIKVSSGTFAQGNYNIGVSASDGPKTLLVEGGTWTQGSGTINQRDNGGTAFTASSGTFTGGSGAITLGGDLIISGGAFTSTSGTLKVNDAFTLSSGSFTHNSGTVQLGDGATGQETLIDADGATITFNHLILNKPDNWYVTVDTNPSNTGLLVAGNFTRTAGVINNGAIEVRGNVTISSGNASTGTTGLLFSGSGTQSFDLTTATNQWDGDIKVNKSGGQVNLATDLTLNATSQDLFIEEGTFDIASYALTVNGTSGKLIVETGGNLQLQGGETITANTSYPQLDSGSAVTYDGTSSYTIKDYTYHHLILNGSGGVFSMGAGETLGGDLTIIAGTFSTAGQNLTVNGTFSNSDTLRTQGNETTLSLTMDTDSGTVEYVGDGDGSAETFNLKETGATDFYHLKINDTNVTKDTFHANAALNVAGTLKVTSGTMTHSGNTVTAAAMTVEGGTFTGGTTTVDINGAATLSSGTWTATSGTTTISGNYTKSGGTFTHNSGTVTLDGTDQELAGATTFNHLTKTVSTARTLTFQASTTFTIAGTLTLTGTSGNLLSLRSKTTNTAFNIDPQGTRTVEYLDVKDSNNTNATIVNCWTGCTNSNGNTAWNFVQPTVTLSVDSAAIAEASAVATFTATLSAVSGATTTVELSTSGTATGSGTDYTLSGTSITISAGSTTGTRTVTAVQDTLDEDGETVVIDISSVTNGTESGTQQQTTTITDDDAAPTVTLSVNNATIAEAAAVATFTATLSAASGKTVTVDLSASGIATGSGTDYTLSGTSITINAGSTTGTRTVTAVQDTLDEDDETAIVDISSVTNGTESGTQQQTTTITDDDNPPTVTLAVDNATITEDGGVATVTATLSGASGKTVTVNLAASGTATGSGTDYTLSGTSIAINAGSTTGTRTVTSVADSLDESNETAIVDIDTITNGTESATQQITVTITDDDTVGVTITQSGGSTNATEGGSSDTYTVVLNTQPTANVTLTLSPGAQASVGLTMTLTFTSSNWNTVQTVTASAVNDQVAEGNHTGTIVHSASSSDSNYHGISISNVTVNITDNDSAGVSVTESSGATAATEGGATDTYTVVLTSEPTANVSITVTAAEDVSTSAATLAFTAANWNTTQTVTVTAVNDNLVEGNHTGAITHTAAGSDANYNGIPVNGITASLTDNDSVGVTVSHTGGSTAVAEGGATDTYTVVLNSEPFNSVTITINPGTQVTLSATTLIFTAANWGTARILTVTAVNDSLAEGSHNATLTHRSASADAGYNNLTINNLVASISDNETAGVSVTESEGSTAVTEDGGEDSYTIVLTSQPSADVTIAVNAGEQLEIAPTSLAFTSSNWNTAQTVAVGATDDEEIEDASHSATITHSITTTDSNYQSVSVSAVLATIADNDAAETSDADDESTEDESDSDSESEVSVCSSSSCTSTTATVVQGVLIAAQGSNQIFLAQDISYANRTTNRLDLPNSTALYTTDTTTPTVLFHNDHIVIADSAYDNDKGRVFTLPISTSNQTIDMTTAESNLPSGGAVADGAQTGDMFGDDVETGDYDCDDSDEIWVLSTGTSYGTVTVLDENLDLIYLVLGAVAEPITSITSAGLGSSCGSDMISSVSTVQDSSLSLARFALAPNSNVVASSSQFYGILASQNASTVINFATDSPDYVVSTGVTVSHMVAGDINGDGVSDLILASSENCELMVILGGTDIGSTSMTVYPDYTSACSEDTDLASLAVGDVNGDGYDDILVGFPQAANGNGTIYVMAGSRNVSNNSVSFSSASTITGSSSSGNLGQWIVINDSDGDGTSDVYTSRGDTSSYTFEAAGLIDTEIQTTAGGITSGSLSGASCSLSKQATQKIGPLILWGVFCLSLLLICRVMSKNFPDGAK